MAGGGGGGGTCSVSEKLSSDIACWRGAIIADAGGKTSTDVAGGRMLFIFRGDGVFAFVFATFEGLALLFVGDMFDCQCQNLIYQLPTLMHNLSTANVDRIRPLNFGSGTAADLPQFSTM